MIFLCEKPLLPERLFRMLCRVVGRIGRGHVCALRLVRAFGRRHVRRGLLGFVTVHGRRGGVTARFSEQVVKEHGKVEHRHSGDDPCMG